MSDPASNAQLANTLFPPPPEYYKQFTDENIERHQTLSSATAGPSRSGKSPSAQTNERQPLSEDETAELERLDGALSRPRADWIREDGRWVTFGEMLTTRPHIPSPADIGLTPLFNVDEPPQTALTPLLHSFLHTLLRLIDVLTNSSRRPDELARHGWGHEGDQYIQHMTNLSANMMVAANQSRGMQAEATLVLMMEKQLAARREQTEALRSKCKAISRQIRSLRSTHTTSMTLRIPAFEEMEVDAQPV